MLKIILTFLLLLPSTVFAQLEIKGETIEQKISRLLESKKCQPYGPITLTLNPSDIEEPFQPGSSADAVIEFKNSKGSRACAHAARNFRVLSLIRNPRTRSTPDFTVDKMSATLELNCEDANRLALVRPFGKIVLCAPEKYGLDYCQCTQRLLIPPTGPLAEMEHAAKSFFQLIIDKDLTAVRKRIVQYKSWREWNRAGSLIMSPAELNESEYEKRVTAWILVQKKMYTPSKFSSKKAHLESVRFFWTNCETERCYAAVQPLLSDGSTSYTGPGRVEHEALAWYIFGHIDGSWKLVPHYLPTN